MHWMNRISPVAVLCLLSANFTFGSGLWSQTLGGGLQEVDLVVDPTNPSVLYAGSLWGGVLKSTDWGAQWRDMNKGLTNPRVRTLVIDPINSSTLYAGTEGGGVFQSTDGGANWVVINNDLTILDVRALAIDPNDSSSLYAGTIGGVFKSVDQGASWVEINSGLTGFIVLTLAVDPSNPSILYAGTLDAGVFRSTDQGASWAAPSSGPSGIRALAIDPTNPSTLYVSTGDGVFKSINEGTSWERINSGLTNTNVRVLTIDPTNSSTLYAGTSGGGVFRSADGGASWVEANSGLTNMDVRTVAIDPTNASLLYAGTFGGGVFRSTDGGSTWVEDLEKPIVQALAVDPSDTSTLYAAIIGGGVFVSSDRGASWGPRSNGLPRLTVFALALDPTNPSNLFAGGFGAGVFRSTDMGANWEEINDGLTTDRVITLAIDPATPSTLYVGTQGGMFKSTDMGNNWMEINSGLTIEVAPDVFEVQSVRSLAIDPTNTSIIYAGTDKGDVFRSTDGGGTWELSDSGLTGGFVETLVFDPTNPSTLYAGNSHGAFRSTNSGANWVGINDGLTGENVQALVIDPTNPSILYAGTDWVNPDFLNPGDWEAGVFKTTDGGESWVKMNQGLTNPRVHSLAIDPVNPSRLYAGTRGGGVFIFVEGASWLYAGGNPSGAQAAFDGLAFTNLAHAEAPLDLEAIASTASTASVRSHSVHADLNRASVSLPSSQQIALLRTDLFEGDPSQPAWIELISDPSQIHGFFQFGSDALSQLDGGVAITETSTDIVLTRVFEGAGAFRGQPATTRVSMLNPNQNPVTVELSYRPRANGAGTLATSAVTRTIEGRSFLDEPVADLFEMISSESPFGEQFSEGLITGRVTEGDGVVAFEVIQLQNQSTVLGLNAATGNSTNRAYSAQLASLPGLFTSVNVVNSSDELRNVTLRAVQENGADQGKPVALVLAPGEQFTEDAGALFGGTGEAGSSPTLASGFVASLILEADGDGVCAGQRPDREG